MAPLSELIKGPVRPVSVLPYGLALNFHSLLDDNIPVMPVRVNMALMVPADRAGLS